MASDHMLRASDQDREAVVATLRDAYTAGRLTLEEFDERTTAAYASRTWGELRKLTEDLPVQPILGSDVPGRHLPASVLPAHPPRADGTPPPARHGRRPSAFAPLVALWLVLAVATRSAHDIIGPTLVLVIALVFMSLARRRLDRTSPSCSRVRCDVCKRPRRRAGSQ
jgi:hypothetical protein